MARPLSIDLRERAVAGVLKGGQSRHRAAAQFGVAASTVINWVWRFQETGSVAPGQMGGHKPKAIAGEHQAFLVQRIRDRELTPRGIGVELGSRGEAQLQKKTVIASERDRPDIARRRARWAKRQKQIGPERLVFIDETWTKTNMAPLRGWAARGARLIAKVPHGHWKTLTFVAALRHDRIEAPFVLDGPINGECFKTYVEKVLVPTLAPGDLVILDNLGSHKGKAIRRAIRAAGAKLFFLPKYSPDLNPIEV